MAKMHKLIQNEYIKTGKKVSTKVIFILIAVSVLALMGLGKFAQYAINENMDYIYEDTIDYSYEINEAEKMQYPGYETDIERMNFIMDNNFQYGSCQMSASYEIFSYETGEPQGNVIPVDFTGSPISSKVTFPPNLSVSTEPRIYPITEGESPVV